MATEVFISWSGEQSRGIARILKRSIREIVPKATIFMADRYTGVGSRWNIAIAEHLDRSDIGIFVVTPANLRSRWLNFEAGAIAKRLKRAQVIPLLVGIENRELTGPLAEFQGLEWSGPSFHRMMKVINRATGSRTKNSRVAKRVRSRWARVNRRVLGVPGAFAETSPLRYLLGDSGRGELISLVFPIFISTKNDGSDSMDGSSGQSSPTRFAKPGQRAGGEHVDDIRPSAMNDLRALCTVAAALSKEGAHCKPVPDDDALRSRDGSPMVCFGLTTNLVTRSYYQTPDNGRSDSSVLFVAKREAGKEVVKVGVDARSKDYIYDDDEFDYGIIARVTQNGDIAGKWLICAGLGPTGTEAAANYLCLNATSIAREFGLRDFVRIVKCTKGNPHAISSDDSDTVVADRI